MIEEDVYKRQLLYGEVAQERMKDSVDVIGRVYRDPFRTLLPVDVYKRQA